MGFDAYLPIMLATGTHKASKKTSEFILQGPQLSNGSH